MKNIIIYLAIVLFTTAFVGCENDEIDKKNSIFDLEDIPAKNEFDVWIHENLVVPYNIRIDYRLDFMDSNFDFNITPPDFSKATGFSQIIKYCWIESYDEVAGIEFMKATAPKQIALIGSKGQDYTMGTSTLGTAEGGTRVVLYDINGVKDYNYSSIVKYMHIMHHEFAHILDQKKKMDPLYGKISQEHYLGELWVNHEELMPNKGYLKLGIITDYGTYDENEDYAEVYSKYLTMTDSEWVSTLESAGKDGADIILRKQQMIKEYLKEHWNIDMVELRNCVQRRIEKASTIEILTFDEFSK